MSDPMFARFGREFRAGEVLFHEGEPGDVMYVVQSGEVRITKRVGQDEKTLATLGPGEFVGEMAILNGKPRTATAAVAKDTKCLVITAKTLESMVAKNAEIAMRLIKKLSKRLDAADALVEILMHRDPKMRVILGLSRVVGFGEPTSDGVRVGSTAASLASDVGVDVQTAQEVLSRLRRLRLVTEAADGSLVVTDVSRLNDFLEFLDGPQRLRGDG